MKMIIRSLAAAVAVFASAVSAEALTITPATTPQWTGSDSSSFSASDIKNAVGTTTTLSKLYKQNVGGGEEGGFKTSYTTTFNSADPDSGLIDYISGPAISGYGELYLYVKDGDSNPAYYIFDISGWNGTDDIVLSGFWPTQGAISNVAIYGGGTTSVPDGGATVALLGLGLAGIGLYRRKMAK